MSSDSNEDPKVPDVKELDPSDKVKVEKAVKPTPAKTNPIPRAPVLDGLVPGEEGYPIEEASQVLLKEKEALDEEVARIGVALSMLSHMRRTTQPVNQREQYLADRAQERKKLDKMNTKKAAVLDVLKDLKVL